MTLCQPYLPLPRRPDSPPLHSFRGSSFFSLRIPYCSDSFICFMASASYHSSVSSRAWWASKNSSPKSFSGGDIRNGGFGFSSSVACVVVLTGSESQRSKDGSYTKRANTSVLPQNWNAKVDDEGIGPGNLHWLPSGSDCLVGSRCCSACGTEFLYRCWVVGFEASLFEAPELGCHGFESQMRAPSPPYTTYLERPSVP